ncbi:unnamed protein product, partial [Prorocentrum cordatum]
VCAEITPDFWRESGQGGWRFYGNWCICVHKLGDWLRSTADHLGIAGINCNATSAEALHGDADAARYIADHCRTTAVREAFVCLGPVQIIEMLAKRLGKEDGTPALVGAS